MTLFIVDGEPSSLDLVTPAAWVLVAAGAGLAWSVFDYSKGLLDLVFWYFFAIVFAWPGLFQSWEHHFPWPSRVSESDAEYSALISILFFACYFTGTTISLGSRRSRRARLQVPVRAVSPAFLWGLILISIICVGWFGIGRLFSSRYEVSNILDEHILVFPYFIGKGVTLAGFLFALGRFPSGLNSQNSSSRSSRNSGDYLLLVVFALLTVAWFNPEANPRFQTVAVVLAPVALWKRKLSRSAKATVISLLGVAQLFLFGPAKNIAMGGRFSLLSLDEMRNYVFRVDFDTYQQLVNSVSYVSRHGILFATNLIRAALFFIPRSLWPSKPDHSGAIVANYMGYSYTNLDCPLQAEFYLAGGLIGVILLAFLLGRFVRRVSLSSARAQVNGFISFSCVVLALSTGYAPILLRGSLGGAFPMIGIAFATVGVSHIWERLFREAPTRPSAPHEPVYPR
jgi:hypothetical protein